ncbi:isoleucine--tRNA ligase [Luteolibacter ambystomatis]|uniref:Isoleucine--tRNA ligase n=1 Tax=Luteolibacter ambystomatis TaxID=2824561 RepID=A0A975G8R0_9BACT|nr:isoleucine--tRNA ligase [Luteolibacter ambystomatis]QUE50887.1 isoleucine--tRNA ligase [Luteolibacter ambystomatis]
MSADAPNYKDTLTLPQTTFPMRGDLVENEPKRLAKWEESGLYQRIIARRQEQKAPKFILHDGPPFANGDVHMGTALNKVLKDLVVKSKTMAGYEAPFIPGWDCHGLPIEFKVVKQAAGLEPAEIRRRCTEFAEKFIDIQRGSFRRLGVFGDWYNPYVTMAPGYEAEILRVFAKLVESGSVYQSKKPVQWSYGAHTALAEAEVEYKEKESPAIFVKFPLSAEAACNLGAAGASMVIWTTTPWTLPANLGVALHPDFTYIVGRFERDGHEETLVVVRELVETFEQKTGVKLVETLQERKGREFENLEAHHPFLDRTSKLILGQFVTTETGSGAVHIAPGHGADDYVAGQQYGLGLLSPVDDDGNFTVEVGVPELVGQHVFKSNDRVIEILEEKGALLGREKYIHSYPHCWRSKTPIIFRAVEQFFISLETLRGEALKAIDGVEWLPAWGRNRIYGTVESRPDWCISRQRTWGVPLPVFFDENNVAILSSDLACKVADLVEKEGTNVWFEKTDAELAELLGLPAGVKKCKDTLDVWIDSGCSHVAVMEKRPELHAPADLYLEATDQHRGWFQSSLMMSIAWRKAAPYKAVLTHGFVVDKDKKGKLSKSEAEKAGKPIDAAHFYNKYGADIVRLWVSSVDWQNEVPFSEDLFKQVAEPYRRLRNTLRILLGNLDGFDPEADRVAPEDMPLLDRWILERLHSVVAECRKAYEGYEFRKVFNALNQFCTTDLSAVYVDVTKDRMYCDARSSLRRRASQTAMFDVFNALAKLLAPILAYTADEAWEHAGFCDKSVHEHDFPEPDAAYAPGKATEDVERLFQIKALIQTAIEKSIQAKEFTRNNEAEVDLIVPTGESVIALLKDKELANEFFILAGLNVTEGAELSAIARKTSLCLCPRCRRHEPLLESGLCERCDEVIAVVNA